MVLGSLSELIVKSSGGFYKFRERFINSPKGIFKKSKILRALYVSLYYAYLNRQNSYIGFATVFKNEPCFPHGISGTFITDWAVIGENAVIFENVVIGTNSLPSSKGIGSPVIGDNCYIGAGASIVGNIVVNDNCRLGSNVTIFENLPTNSVAVSEKPRIIHKEKIDNTFYSLRNNKWCFFKNGYFYRVTDQKTLSELREKIRDDSAF
jgi:serine O-acetyltransferase